MSYRNPQIIVDRSAEIWAQGVAKVGDVLNRGIEAYATAKRKSEDAKRKRDEAKNRFLVNAEIEQDKNIVKAVGEIKDTKVRDVFSKIFTEKGDAAIKAQTELAMNTNLSQDDRKQYRKTISDFQSYMLNSKGSNKQCNG